MIPSTAKYLMDRLAEYGDARTGLPIESHRARVGAALVVAKKAFRKGFQPFINEALRRQVLFNETATETLKSVFRELASLESAVLSFRTANDVRLRKLEEAVAALQQQAAHDARPLELVKDVAAKSES